MINRVSQKHRSFKVFTCVFNVVLAVYIFKSTPYIGFGPVDDHEIIRYLGPDRHLRLSEIFSTLIRDTEVGDLGINGRFRPSYYIVRLFETFVFGAREYLWFSFRISIVVISSIMLSLVIFELFRNLSVLITTTLSSALSLLVLSQPSWPDIVMRLGPSEIFLVGGLVAFLYLSVLYLHDQSRQRLWFGALITAMFTIGTKENAAVLLVLTGIFALLSYKRRPFSRSQKLFTVAVGILGFLIILIPIINTVNTATDIYGNQRNIGQLWSDGLDYFSSTSGTRNSVLFAFAIFLLRVTFIKQKTQFRLLLVRGYVLIFVNLVSISEYIFYRGQFTEPRYRVLTDLTEVLQVLFVIALVIEVLYNQQLQLVIRQGTVAVTSCILCVLSSVQYVDSAQEFEKIGEQKIEGSKKFKSQISHIGDKLKKDDFDSVVIIINNVWEYEPAFSISHFISFEHGVISKYLKLNQMSVNSEFEQELLDQMIRFSKNGSKEWGITEGPIPLSGKNLCVALQSGFTDPDICDSSVISE